MLGRLFFVILLGANLVFGYIVRRAEDEEPEAPGRPGENGGGIGPDWTFDDLDLDLGEHYPGKDGGGIPPAWLRNADLDLGEHYPGKDGGGIPPAWLRDGGSGLPSDELENYPGKDGAGIAPEWTRDGGHGPSEEHFPGKDGGGIPPAWLRDGGEEEVAKRDAHGLPPKELDHYPGKDGGGILPEWARTHDHGMPPKKLLDEDEYYPGKDGAGIAPDWTLEAETDDEDNEEAEDEIAVEIGEAKRDWSGSKRLIEEKRGVRPGQDGHGLPPETHLPGKGSK